MLITRTTWQLFLGAVFALSAVGCGPTTDRWTGSVDAVFKYRPGDRSTVIHEIRAGSLSEQAGLQAGDRLLSVDGEDVSDADFEAVRAVLRGPVGTSAVLRVRRGTEVVEISVERLPLRDD